MSHNTLFQISADGYSTGTTVGTDGNLETPRMDEFGATRVVLTSGGQSVGSGGTVSTSALGTGQQAATTAAAKLNGGTATAFIGGVVIECLSSSSISVFLGGSSVTTSTGMELAPGSFVSFPIADISKIYIVAVSSSSATVTWLGI